MHTVLSRWEKKRYTKQHKMSLHNSTAADNAQSVCIVALFWMLNIGSSESISSAKSDIVENTFDKHRKFQYIFWQMYVDSVTLAGIIDNGNCMLSQCIAGHSCSNGGRNVFLVRLIFWMPGFQTTAVVKELKAKAALH